jgi:nucleoside-diphosphate-sugar epimerase
MNLHGKTILVTGGTGFIGGRLIEKLILEHRARVRVMIRQFSTAVRVARFPVEIVCGDITDETFVRKAVAGCDYVFHCAHDYKLSKDVQSQAAAQATKNISEAVIDEGVSRMIHVSSLSVYGSTSDGALTEQTLWTKSDHAYVEAKRAAEQLVLELYKEKHLPVVVLQPTIVYGPFAKVWTLDLINQLKTGTVPLVNGGQGYCNPVYIDDCIDAMLLAATKPDVLGETFLISGKEPVNWKTFYNAFEVALGIQATTNISEEKIKEMQKNQIPKTNMIHRLVDLLRDEKFSLLVKSTPIVGWLLGILSNSLSCEQRIALKSKILRTTTKNKQENTPGKPIHVPNEALLAIYLAKTSVSIDKAQKLLGYNPKFDFAQGMELTSQYIHWANLD